MLRIPIEAAPALSTPAWVDVDLDAVAHNVRAFRTLLPADCRLVAVVKANAYGHGMVACARAALQHGASELAVANVHEGAQLRAAGVTAPILVAGPTAPGEAGLVVQHGLLATVATVELAQALAAATRRYLPVQIEVDTGMGRHGVAPHALGAFVDRLAQRGRLTVAGVYTHFAATSVADGATMRAQLAAFHAAVDAVRSLRGARRHACNTLGALTVPEARLDAVRIGGGLYGFDPFHGAGTRGPLALRPALALKARLVGLRDLPAGAPVGYGGAFVCARASRLGLVPLGYADGLPRARWGGAPVLVRGVRAPVVGAVSMNQTIVDVTDVPGASLGDEVVLLGAQGGECIAAEERVEPGGSAYEVTTLLRAALPRRDRAAAGAGAARVGRGPAVGGGGEGGDAAV
ncbi:MAG: alanine racemase [Planctomycetota bacterium]